MERKGTGKLREENNQKVLRYFIENRCTTKKEVALYCDLSVMTVGTILNNFLQDKIIFEKETIISRKGRPTQKYSLYPDYYHLLIFYILKEEDQYHIHWQVKNALSQIIQENNFFQVKIDLDQVIFEIKKIINNDKLIENVGIGLPVSISNNEIIESDIPELKNYSIKQFIESATNKRVFIFNDMNCTAYGYYMYNKVKENLCFITFPKNTEPGCGNIINGQLLEGKNSIAGEIVYLPVFHFLKNPDFQYTLNDISQAVASISSILNPHLILLTGENILQGDIPKIKEECLFYIPEKFMPEIQYIKDYKKYYLIGIEKCLINQLIKE